MERHLKAIRFREGMSESRQRKILRSHRTNRAKC